TGYERHTGYENHIGYERHTGYELHYGYEDHEGAVAFHTQGGNVPFGCFTWEIGSWGNVPNWNYLGSSCPWGSNVIGIGGDCGAAWWNGGSTPAAVHAVTVNGWNSAQIGCSIQNGGSDAHLDTVCCYQ